MAKKTKVKKSKKLDTNAEVTESDTNICETCKGRLVKVETKIIDDGKFDILKCEKCKHTIARNVDER